MRIFSSNLRPFLAPSTVNYFCISKIENAYRDCYNANIKKIIMYNGAAYRYEQKGNNKTALKYYSQSLKISKLTYAKNSPGLSMQHEYMARCYEKSGNKTLALAHRKQSIFWIK